MEAVTPLSLADAPAAEKLRGRILNPVLLPLFLLGRLPLALAAGVRVRVLTAESCAVTVGCGWRNKNPFGSMYFAVQAMGAEMSTGAPALVACRAADPTVASLIVGLRAEYVRQARSRVTFTCSEVGALTAAVERAWQGDEAVRVTVPSVGTLEDGTVVSRFEFDWSFKGRRR